MPYDIDLTIYPIYNTIFYTEFFAYAIRLPMIERSNNKANKESEFDAIFLVALQA